MKFLRDTTTEIIHSNYPEWNIQDITLAIPPEKQEWDFAINIIKFAKSLGKNPMEFATELQGHISEKADSFRLAQVVWAYINLCLTDEEYLRMADRSLSTMTVDTEPKDTVVIDYIWVNIGKPLHIGHICTPSIGQVFCNIYRHKSMNVIWDVHTGDWWGIFWRLIVGWEKWGDEEKFQQNPVEHLLELYQNISALIEPESWEKNISVEEQCREEFKKLSSGDPKNMDLWAKFTKESLKNMQQTIDLLHVYPDVSIGESFYEGLPLPRIWEYPDLTHTMSDVVDELIAKWIAVRWEDGSVGVVFEEESNIPSNMLQKSNGTHGYFASDLACIKYRTTNGWDPKKIIYCTDVRQETHFKQVFATAKKAWWIGGDVELIHASNGFISLPEWAMSTRKWNIIRLQDLIDEAFVRTKKILEEKWRGLSDDDTREIAVSAMKYSYLMQDREKNSVFSWEKALSFEGNSWPYIQYSFVRAMKLVKESGLDFSSPLNFSKYQWVNLTVYEKRLMRNLAQMEEKIDAVLVNHKPHILASFCYDLATSFNSFYAHTPNILQDPDSVSKEFRLSLVKYTADKLKTCFELLGMAMPTEM